MAVVLDFEGGVAGNAIPTSATVQEVSGAQYTATAMHGSLGMECTSNSEYIRVNFTNGIEHSGSIYFRSDAIASSRVRLVTIAASGNSVIAAISIHSDGKFDLFDTVRRVASSVNWQLNTWHRIDWQFVEATKTLTVRIFLTAEGAVHDDEISYSFGSVSTPAKWMIGAVTSVAGTTVQFDTFSAVSGLSWIGPFGTPVLQPGDVIHHWVGAQTAEGFTVHSKTSAATSVEMVVGTDSSVTQNLQTFGPDTPDTNGYVNITATSLSPSTTYYYQLQDTPTSESASRIGPIGTATTLPANQANFTFAFGNCTTNANQDMHAYDEILALNPLFFVHLGDFHYENSASETPDEHRANLENQIAAISGLKTLLQNIPTYYLRSDHDGGGSDNSDAGAYYIANQTAAKQVAPFPTLANQPTDALYFSWVVGRVRFIALDLRGMYRSPGADPQSSSKTMLGATQKQWLKDQLVEAEPVKVVLSDSPWIGAASLTDATDKWWAYDDERTEIGNYITANNVRVLMVTGDLHSIYADDGTNNTWGGFPIIGAGPLANVGGFRGGPYQQLWFPGLTTDARNFGSCSVTDTGAIISVAFTGRDALNDVDRVTMSVSWDITGWFEWDGAHENPLVLEGEYNGSTVDPLTTDAVT